jgi:hypothetical protein
MDWILKYSLPRRASTQLHGLCYQNFAYYHPDVFIFILSLSEGWAGIAWEPSTKNILPQKKNVRHFSPTIFLRLYSSTLIHNSFFLSFKSKRLNLIPRVSTKSCHRSVLKKTYQPGYRLSWPCSSRFSQVSPCEYQRDILASDEFISSHRQLILHKHLPALLILPMYLKKSN